MKEFMLKNMKIVFVIGFVLDCILIPIWILVYGILETRERLVNDYNDLLFVLKHNKLRDDWFKIED